MQALKFKTKVLENGIIQIPEIESYVNQEVEISVVLIPIKPIRQKK
jgi:hypothetical protein